MAPNGEIGPDDASLLSAWREGDRSAGELLVERHFAVVHGFLRDKVDVDAVDDLVQRTFVACVEHQRKFRGEGSFRAWLLGIARNQLMMHYRSKDASTRARDRIEALSVDDLVTSPSRVVAHKEEQAILLRALRRIPLDSQLVLELFYWEGLDHAEVAQVLEIAVGTVKSRLSRARERLVDALRELGAPDAVTRSTVVELEAWVRSLGRD
jgi:RNA polymerase sigma factor (sigma-70 family)